MAIKHLTAAVAVLVALAAGAMAAPGGSPSVSTPVTELKFGPTGVSDGDDDFLASRRSRIQVERSFRHAL